AAHRERLEALLEDRVLVLPAASSAAPALGSDLEAARAATMRLTCIAGLTGRPGLSVPALRVPGPAGGDAPVGLGLVGPRGSDLALVDLGVALSD
ncbi:amidase, partial [Mesorhizobium japonicum]